MFPSKRFSKAGEEILIAFFSFSFKVNAHPVHGFSKLTSLAYTLLGRGGRAQDTFPLISICCLTQCTMVHEENIEIKRGCKCCTELMLMHGIMS